MAGSLASFKITGISLPRNSKFVPANTTREDLANDRMNEFMMAPSISLTNAPNSVLNVRYARDIDLNE